MQELFQFSLNNMIIPTHVKLRNFWDYNFYAKYFLSKSLLNAISVEGSSENYFVAYISFFYDSMLCMPVLFFSILIQINAIILLNGIKTS